MKITSVLKTIKQFLTHRGFIMSLCFSLLAIGLSAYNTYLIKRADPGTLTVINEGKKMTKNEINKIIRDGAPVLGDPNAPVAIIEFADFQCPFCGRFFTSTLPELKSKYINTGKAKFIFMNFAFLGEESRLTGQAAKCAQDQGKFWEYHDYIYNHQRGENQGAFSKNNLKNFASAVGLKQLEFNQCLDSGKYVQKVDEETQVGRSFGVSATPSTFVNDFLIVGSQPASNFSAKIEAILKGK